MTGEYFAMTPLKITQDADSLREATEIISKTFSRSGLTINNALEWNKWEKWFQKSKNRFFSGETSAETYFNQINRVHKFILDNTSLEALFLIETSNKDHVRKRKDAFSKKLLETPLKLSDNDFRSLLQILFDHQTKPSSTIKPNPRVESLTAKKRELRIGRIILSDLNKETERIEDSQIMIEDPNQRYEQLGEFYIELGDYKKAKDSFNRISSSTLKNAALTWLACLRKDFTSFQEHILKAFPESYEPTTSGIYTLSFLIGNEKNYTYEIDSKGKRSISFIFSTGIYKIAEIEVLTAFFDDLRLSPDLRKGMWLRPGEFSNNFTYENLTHLHFKQVLGWKDFS